MIEDITLKTSTSRTCPKTGSCLPSVHLLLLQRVSTLFQPNFWVFGIDLSGGGCWELPMSTDIHFRLRTKSDFCRCKSRFSCVSVAFQLRFSHISAQLRAFLFVWKFLMVPKYPPSSKSNFWSNLFFVFQLRFSCQKRGAHPLLLL